MLYIYSNKKVTSVAYGSVSIDPITLSPQKYKPNFFPNARHTKTGNQLNLSSIPKELSNQMLNNFFNYCKEVNCQIVAFITLKKNIIKTQKQLIKEQNSSSKSLI